MQSLNQKKLQEHHINKMKRIEMFTKDKKMNNDYSIKDLSYLANPISTSRSMRHSLCQHINF